MVESDRLYQGEWNPPNAHQVSADFRVRASPSLPLASLDTAAAAKEFVRLARHFRQQHQFADVMQQPSRKTLLDHRTDAILGSRDILREGRHRDTVVPDREQAGGNLGAAVEWREDTQGQYQSAQGFRSYQ